MDGNRAGLDRSAAPPTAARWSGPGVLRAPACVASLELRSGLRRHGCASPTGRARATRVGGDDVPAALDPPALALPRRCLPPPTPSIGRRRAASACLLD